MLIQLTFLAFPYILSPAGNRLVLGISFDPSEGTALLQTLPGDLHAGAATLLFSIILSWVLVNCTFGQVQTSRLLGKTRVLANFYKSLRGLVSCPTVSMSLQLHCFQKVQHRLVEHFWLFHIEVMGRIGDDDCLRSGDTVC